MSERPQTMVEALAARWERHVLAAERGDPGPEADARWWLRAFADEVEERYAPLFIPEIMHQCEPMVRRAIVEHHREIVAHFRAEAERPRRRPYPRTPPESQPDPSQPPRP